MEFIVGKYNYWIYICLMMIGFYAMIGKRNLVKKLIGMNIFQTSIILYFISTGSKKGATIPIVEHGASAIQAGQYINPLPHVLMLTAIVVMVSTFGVALALLLMIYRRYHTLEEDEILRLRR
ncbi:MAG: cation:proton antiporter subunit C [Deltaproteobacteria bacterium]|jgi:multicomponent Na+:H+ antiporter subunit C|nr:cation:proton antiporter subunit C [Thermodesulfobacteriota bacterium]MDP2968180.1 cation:proton antiporter subunit C [Deltaproteobacteria bacterium]